MSKQDDGIWRRSGAYSALHGELSKRAPTVPPDSVKAYSALYGELGVNPRRTRVKKKEEEKVEDED